MVDSISPAMEKIHRMVQRVAPTDLSVLIGGESGVGKEVVAQRIYSESRLCLSQIHRKLDLKTSFVAYPVEADALEPLVDLALRRLRP